MKKSQKELMEKRKKKYNRLKVKYDDIKVSPCSKTRKLLKHCCVNKRRYQKACFSPYSPQWSAWKVLEDQRAVRWAEIQKNFCEQYCAKIQDGQLILKSSLNKPKSPDAEGYEQILSKYERLKEVTELAKKLVNQLIQMWWQLVGRSYPARKTQ